MSTLNRPQKLADLQEFLQDFDHTSARRGAQYFRSGAVLELECTEGSHYSAVVRGSQDYEVSLSYDGNFWDGECSCPVSDHCKHLYATALALQKMGKSAVKRFKEDPKSNIVPLPTPPPEPSSPLLARLTKESDGALKAGAKSYVRCVQALFKAVCEQKRFLTAYDFRLLSSDFGEYGWQPLEIWPEPPKDDYEFWLYCAWELRRRGLAIPGSMAKVTDLTIIEPRMRMWERSKEIAHWREQLTAAQLHSSHPALTEPADLRLALYPERVVVQWRATADEPFRELNQSLTRRLMQAHEKGAVTFCPEATSLWLALYKPYDYYSWSNLKYALPDTVKLLNRIVRLPALGERIVTAQGTPFARPAEPLRFALCPAESDDGDYALSLVRADGSPVPEILLTLPGHPTFYLTTDTIYAGPPPHGFGNKSVVTIPAPALESAPGLGFVLGMGLDLPPRLASRTRRVQVIVKVFCELKPIYVGSPTEAVFIRATVDHEDGGAEYFTSNGWQPDPSVQRKKVTALKDDLIPVLDRAAQHHFPRLLEALNGKWEGFQGKWRVRLNRSFPDTFVPWLASLPENVEVHLDRELATFQNAPLAGSVRLDVEEAGVDWFDLKVVLDLSDTELTPEELKLLLNARGGFVRLGKKGWRRLQFNLTQDEDERLARLGLDARDFTAEPQRLHALQLADESASKLLPEQQVEKIQRRVGELKARVAPALPDGIRATLRPYQTEGFHFLAYLTANRFGGVLADDMGLGKTLQALTWIAWLREQRRAGVPPALPPSHSTANGVLPAPPAGAGGAPALPSLVVCPKSVMDNWQSEAAQFLPELRVRLWRGEDAGELTEARGHSDLIVLNYAQLRSLSPDIAQMQWHTAILDEAQYIKNPDSQTAQVARALTAEHRLALTGTPIENRLLDLWSILAYAMPGVLGNRAQFIKKFNAQDDPFARRRLAARVRPFLLRRTKNQVAKDLPDRIEEDLLCELEAEQKTLYRAEFKRAQQLLLKVQTKQELNEQRFNFLTSLLRLRQICCHPALVDNTLRRAESAKLNALVDLLEPLMDEGHKVLVFSQFVTMLDLVRETVAERQWQQFYLAGETENRGELVKEFQNAKGAAVFLISLKAGGFGLNLTAASYVVLFDPWWNPAVESQAIDRTHRIGQKNKVIAYRLLMKNSIEQKIRQLQKSKAALAQDVLGEETFAKSLTLEDLRFLFAEE